MNTALSQENYDGSISALTGNGELCTQVGPTGYHRFPDESEESPRRTQQFALAGRRRSDATRGLLNFGTLVRSLTMGRDRCHLGEWTQEMDIETGMVTSILRHPGLWETTRSAVSLTHNVFFAETTLRNTGQEPKEVRFGLEYLFDDPNPTCSVTTEPRNVVVSYGYADQSGRISLRAETTSGSGAVAVVPTQRGGTATLISRLEPGESVSLTTWVTFSDRLHHQTPIIPDEIAAIRERHTEAWAEFWGKSQIMTGHAAMDEYRRRCLYTIRCQTTPWSIPSVLAKPFAEAGYGPDEIFPMLALLGSNHAELAELAPTFRLATCNKACERSIGRGAWFPWSSTESGEERSPDGPALTARYGAGHIAESAWQLCLREASPLRIAEFYPLFKEIARYFDRSVITLKENAISLKPGLDLDHAAGVTLNVMYTLAAATRSFQIAGQAAQRLAIDAELSQRWHLLAEMGAAALCHGERFELADDQPLHLSTLGPIFPFGIETGTDRAKKTVRTAFEALRSAEGWRPGRHELYDSEQWPMAAAHLAAAYVCVGDGDSAWDLLSTSPASAAVFLSPYERMDAKGKRQTPWFTPSAGLWVAALNAMFVRVDDAGTWLLNSVPDRLKRRSAFMDLLASHGVKVSATIEDGKLTDLTARADAPLEWTYRIRSEYVAGRTMVGSVVDDKEGWTQVKVPVGTDPMRLIAI